ncbi:MAG: hypothetical protein KGJ02_06955 [Verrucomicrobiota bacterium]|nr:hypothetical protein [Verrucomicrobiota bacterium]
MPTVVAPTTPDIITPYSPIAKILKVPVFRLALGNDLVSRITIAVHNFFSRICSFFGCSNRAFLSFDPARAQASLDRFIALGAEASFVTPRDGKGKVQMMTFSARDLDLKITDLGGTWERMTLNNREVFAITPSSNITPEWTAFKEKLSHFHWPEEDGKIITCDCADAIPADAPTQCFLYAHSTSSSFTSDWKRAGFYIGAKQDLCFFDNGNTWKNSGRPPSEESFYLEIEAVHENIKDRYHPEQLWVGGSCGGAPVAAYLKRRLHDQGVNFFTETSFYDLNDFVRPISPFFAPRIKGCLKSTDLPAEMEDRPPFLPIWR